MKRAAWTTIALLAPLLLLFVATAGASSKSENEDFDDRPKSLPRAAPPQDLDEDETTARSEESDAGAVPPTSGGGADERVEDPNPSKIPSLMDDDSSSSAGLLAPQDIDLADQCFPKPKCDPDAKFRTADGGCNNLRFPVWGQSKTASTRIVQADYSDGKDQPRKSESGRELPNSRHVRTSLFPDANKPAPKHNLYTMQFGQMIAHDTELTIVKTVSNGNAIKCCDPDGSAPKTLPKGCLQIPTPEDDPDRSKRCFSTQRAADTADLGCQIKPVRKQIGVTSFIDASLLYGSDDKTARSLRTFKNGRLRSQVGDDGKSYLPNVKNATQSCNVAKDNTVCYDSGDIRVNQHPDISVQTILMLRMHNILCNEFTRINPSWDDERIYQEARRLLIAMYQHVTYSEFLPILIGKDYCRANKLLPLNEGFDENYNQFLNPTTFTSFTAAAFRSLHSYIQGFIDLVNEARRATSKIRLSDFYMRTDIVQRRDSYDSFIRGMLTQKAQGQDRFFTEEISEFLFRVPNKTIGLDLVALDIERGRDFGVPSYNKIRKLCGLNEAKTFDDFTDQIRKPNVDALANVYESVNDVDFYPAGLLEEAKPGAILGHTFQCIVGEMFFRWKFGDRFYYEFGNQPGSFSSAQLREIRKTTLALMTCMTSDIQTVQRNGFDVPGSSNPLVPCKSIPRLDLAAWIER